MTAAPVILVEAQPARVADGVAETVRLAGGGNAKPYTYLGANDWRAGIVRLPTVIAALTFRGGEIGLGGVPAAAEIEWAPARREDLAAMAGYFWADAAIAVRIGPEGPDPPIALSGRVLEPTIDGGVLKLALADPAAAIKTPFPVERFAGTGGLEGPAEWNGLLRRRVWGRVWNQPGQPIDKANNIYCFADPLRPIQALDAVRDKGAAAAALTSLAWAGTAAATFAALQAAAAPQGGGVVCPALACVKWWTQPAGDLTADLRGEVGAGYVETVPEIAERLVAAAGGPGFAAGTVAAAAAARPGAAGWALRDDNTTTSAMLDELLGGVSLLWVLDGTGAIVLREWAWGASVASARSLAVSRKRTFRPLAARKLGYKRNELPMARGDLAAILFADSLAYLDGTPIEALQPAEAGAEVNSGIAGVAEIAIPADYLGAAAGLPRSAAFKLIRQGADVTAAATWGRTVLSGTITTSVAAGVLTVSAFAGNEAVVRLSAEVGGGSPTLHDVRIVKTSGSPPPSGGSGGGTSQSGGAGGSFSSTTPTPIAGPLTVDAGPAGQVQLSAPLGFTVDEAAPNGSFGAYAQWQELNGSAWVGLGSEVPETDACVVIYDPDFAGYYLVQEGSIAVSHTRTGLTANSTGHQFRLVARTPSGARARYPYGTASAVGS